MADTPEHGVRRASSNAALELPDDDASTAVAPPPSPRHSLQRRITRPSFMTELVAGSVVGEYEVQAQIGEGAMGTVYSGVHPLIGKKVAIKVLKPELCANQASIDRFVHEAQAVNKIGHPNIVDVFSLGELEDGRAYFVMEWLRGEDLKARLAKGPLDRGEACEILDGIARALDAAHSNEIIHRDLKPENVFLQRVDNDRPMVKLLDFGIAKLVRATPGVEKTQTGNMLGTPKYISPEQARGVHVDQRSDIYSLGVLAYEMLAGRAPFDGETAMDLVVKHLNEAPPPLSQFAKVPKNLEQCVMSMLAKDPDKRPSLEEVRGILIDPSRRLTPLPGRLHATPSPVGSRSKWPIIATALVAVAGAGILTWKLAFDHHDSSSPAPVANVAPQPDEQPTPVAVEPPSPPQQPVPAPPPEPEMGTLEVSVTGAKDSTILVDAKEVGKGASVKVELPPGKHVVTVKPPGQKPITQTLTVDPGQSNKITIVAPRERIVVRNAHPVVKTQPKEQPKQSDDALMSPTKKKHK